MTGVIVSLGGLCAALVSFCYALDTRAAMRKGRA